VSDTAPGSPTAGALWWNSTLGALFLYYNDGNTSQWVPAAPAAPVSVSASTPGGDFMASGVPTLGSGNTVLVLPTIVSGNSGSWYNVANGQYKPPAGRYYISCGCSAGLSGAGSFQMSIGIRKNSVQTASRTYNDRTTAFTYGGVVTDGVFDANGTTDQFDVIVNVSAAASLVDRAWICAFPISGIKGPPGDAAPGAVIQTVNFETGAVATGTTIMPVDDTIPQITEGDQYMTLAITPKSATSKLIIAVSWMGTINNSGASAITAALFQDATVNALAVGWFGTSTAGLAASINFTHNMISGTTSATTFRVRVGSAIAGSTTMNGSNGARLMGGVMASSIIIQEVAS
jgi:hypothetical protein